MNAEEEAEWQERERKSDAFFAKVKAGEPATQFELCEQIDRTEEKLKQLEKDVRGLLFYGR